MIWNKAKRHEAQQEPQQGALPAQNFEMAGQAGATAQALDQAGATYAAASMQRPQLVTPISDAADFPRMGQAEAQPAPDLIRGQTQQSVTAASRAAGGAGDGARPVGQGDGQGSGPGAGGPGNGGQGGGPGNPERFNPTWTCTPIMTVAYCCKRLAMKQSAKAQEYQARSK